MKLNSSAKVYTIVALTAIVLLLLYYIPPITIGDVTLRKVDLLSDLEKEPDTLASHLKKPRPKGKFKYTWPKGVTPMLDFGTDSLGALDHFFEALTNNKKMNRPVRVAYFGDSFIEADIMVSELRRQLQQAYGNGGPGWMNASQLFGGSWVSMRHTTRNMTSYCLFRHKVFDNAEYTMPQSYSKMTASQASCNFAPPIDTLYTSSWLHTSVFAKTTASPLTISCGGVSKAMKASPHIQMVQFGGSPDSQQSISFNGSMDGTTLYGYVLENDHGIVIDNLGVRGVNGMNLPKMRADLLADFGRLRDYDLIVLHFGLNVVNSAKGDKFCQNYIRILEEGIQHLRKVYPNVSILIVGPSDMQARVGGSFVTRPGVEKISAFEQQLASDGHYGFVSMLEVMGGPGSMSDFVDKHLAERDYTHINIAGGKIVGARFAKTFKAAYDNYKRKKKAGY